MFSSKIIVIYRIMAVLILAIPIAVNIYSKGGIVSSILYVPLMTMGLAAIAIFIDGQLEDFLNRPVVVSRGEVPVASTDDNHINATANMLLCPSVIQNSH